ncbi:MAG: hypothetical protein ABW252_17015 [Polyangiales bacterium]
MGKLLRVKPFLLLIVAWLAGLVRLHAWAQEEEHARPARLISPAASIALHGGRDAHADDVPRTPSEQRGLDDL